MKTKAFAIVAVVAALALAASFAGQGSSAAPKRPNIVFILTDDLSWNLVKYMPHVREMRERGVTFSRFYVPNSLCCPSRASILTGKLPHDTHIFTNGGKQGGFQRFHARGEERQTFAVRLQSAGYRTALMGKYLNEYQPAGIVDGKRRYVPPGWDAWDVGGNAYENFDYSLNENGKVVSYGSDPSDYLTDVLAEKGRAFVAHTPRKRPFLLEIATFAPHKPYTPAPRNENDFPRLRAPRTPAFNEANISDKPSWLSKRPVLRRLERASIDEDFRLRAQSVLAVDDLIGRLQQALKESGELSNTYFFFSSDNGLHMGEHRLPPGKQTAFETDIRVPLIVTGPGVPEGKKISKLASSIDLYPTFAQLGGASVPAAVDGHSLVPLLESGPVSGWRKAVLVEHHGLDLTRSDPDFPGPYVANPTTYQAIRTARATYVEYANGEREYYNLRKDPYELRNTAKRLSPVKRKRLHARLVALARCHGSAGCWKAAGGRALPPRPGGPVIGTGPAAWRGASTGAR